MASWVLGSPSTLHYVIHDHQVMSCACEWWRSHWLFQFWQPYSNRYHTREHKTLPSAWLLFISRLIIPLCSDRLQGRAMTCWSNSTDSSLPARATFGIGLRTKLTGSAIATCWQNASQAFRQTFQGVSWSDLVEQTDGAVPIRRGQAHRRSRQTFSSEWRRTIRRFCVNADQSSVGDFSLHYRSFTTRITIHSPPNISKPQASHHPVLWPRR